MLTMKELKGNNDREDILSESLPLETLVVSIHSTSIHQMFCIPLRAGGKETIAPYFIPLRNPQKSEGDRHVIDDCKTTT